MPSEREEGVALGGEEWIKIWSPWKQTGHNGGACLHL